MSNRLKYETSPYLLQHANNPVDWYPWGEEALKAARELDRPIFLSVGYAACHWCHVMAHESFEDPAVAERLNRDFISVKVDREERPDIDSIYMDSVVAMTGQGGWPMSVFLTPEGKPFFGGTYFPPVRRFNMPSFPEVLANIAQVWRADRDKLEEVGDRLTHHLSSTVSLPSMQEAFDTEILQQAASRLHQAYDWENGGWGAAPKFPQPLVINFLLRKYLRDHDLLALDMVKHALEKMARGGIYDHLGGGFARYSVDQHWLVPHFEKMLYDNAQLATTYLRAWQVTGEKTFLNVVEATLSFLIREMNHPDGGFFSSLDADSDGIEGKFYVWTTDEIRDVLAENEINLFLEAYGVTEQGNFEGANILHRKAEDPALAKHLGLSEEEVNQILRKSREKLFTARQARVAPSSDDKILTAWNGLALTVFAEAAQATGREEYISVAQATASFVLNELFHEGRLKRSWREGRAVVDAFLIDHAALADGLLALYQLDFNPGWLQTAVQLADWVLERFDDPEGGFYDTHADHKGLIARPKTIQDSPLPSGNALACSILMKISSLTGDLRYSAKAEATLLSMQRNAAQQPTAFAEWLNAFDYALGPQLQLALIGDIEEEGLKKFTETVRKAYYPNLVMAGGSGAAEAFPALLEGRPLLHGQPTAYLCENFACNLPTNSPETLREQLAGAQPAKHPNGNLNP